MRRLFHSSVFSKPLSWRLAVAVCIAACVGCGVAPQSSSPLKLTLLGLGLEAGEHLREDALAEYSRKTGLDFDLIPTPGTSAEQLPLVIDLLRRHSKSPDIFLIDNTWPGILHADLLDLTPYLTQDARGHGVALLKNNTIDGRLVGLPLYMNAGMLFYRRDLLRKYGYSGPPATWKELEAMASRIQREERRAGNRSFWGYLWQGGAYEGLTCNALEWQAAYGGGNIVESDGTVTVNNSRTAEALHHASRWIGVISPKSVLAYTEADTLNVFRTGNAAFMRHWSTVYPSVRDSGSPGSVGVALLPKGPAGRAHTIGGFQLAVSKYSAHPKEAAELVIYLTGSEVQARRALRRGYLPTHLSLHQSEELRKVMPQVEAFRDAGGDEWILRPSTTTGSHYADVSEAYYRSVHSVLSGKMKAEAALGQLAQKLKQLLGTPAATLRP